MSKFTDKRKIRKKVPVRLTTYPAVLGDDNGKITVPGRPNFVYARVGGNVEQVFNNRTPAVAGLLVVVGRDEQDPQRLGVFQVLSVRTNAPGGINGPSYGGYAPAARYRIFDPDGGQDPLYVEERQYLPLGVFPYSGQTVQIFPGSCYTGSGVTWVEWQTVDLSGFTPAGAGDACEVMITVDTTGAVIATAGADYVMNSNITADDRLAQAPAIPTGTARVIGLVRVYNGQTTIQEARNTTDIFDLRSAAISLGDSALPETIYGKNESGGSIVKGQAISITAASGQWTAFDLTDATDPGSAYAFIGLAAENAANNDFFNVAISRELSGFSTIGLTEGGAVYVNPASPGNLTASFPSAPNYIINVGICERVHANQGRIQIAKLIQPKLSELSDVTRTPPSITGQVPEWNNTTKTWGYTSGSLASTYLKLDASNDPLTGALEISTSAPSLALTDTTTSAKSLTIAVDANVANIRESAGASGSLFLLDLANNVASIGSSANANRLLNLFRASTNPTADRFGLYAETNQKLTVNSTFWNATISSISSDTADTIANNTGQIIAAWFQAQARSTSAAVTHSNLTGFYAQAYITAACAAIISNIYGVSVKCGNTSTAGGIASSVRQIYINTPYTTGAITNLYGIYIEPQTGGGTSNYAIYSNAGLVRFGDQVSVIGSANRIQEIIRANPTQTTALVQHQDSSANVHNQLSIPRTDGALIETVFNEQGNALLDFRVEADTEPNALWVDASADKVYLGGNTAGASTIISKGGGLSLPYVAQTSNYTLTDADYTVNATSGSFTLTLPTAVGRAGKVFQCNNSGAGLVVVDADGSELINGDLTVTLAQWEQITVQSTGAGWILIH